MESTGNANMPEKKLRFGGVTVTLWCDTRTGRDGHSFKSRSVTLDRAYKDANGQWKNTGSLKETDVPKAILALQEAYKYIVQASDKDD